MKYEVTDHVIYRTVYFTVEADNGEVYNVSLVENDVFDDWRIMDEKGNEINYNADLYDELVMLCEEKLKGS